MNRLKEIMNERITKSWIEKNNSRKSKALIWDTLRDLGKLLNRREGE